VFRNNFYTSMTTKQRFRGKYRLQVLDAQAQNAADENTRVFAQWRARHGLTLAQSAQALGMTARTMSAYGTGARPVPRYIALAVKGWEADRAAA